MAVALPIGNGIIIYDGLTLVKWNDLTVFCQYFIKFVLDLAKKYHIYL